MQFKITFKVEKKGKLLPLSYQYELSSWIYKVIYSGDHEFGRWLHDKGYHANGNKRFKFFTFSNLYIPDFERIDDRLRIKSDSISFVISFFIDKVAQKMIHGVFQHQKFELGDRITKVPLSVESIKAIDLSIPSDTVKIRTTSPLVVVEQTDTKEGKSHHNYIHPEEDDFQVFFIENLINKYYTARQHQLISEVKGLETISIQSIGSKIKKKGVRIKAHTKAETKVIGYECEFELTAPKELIRLGILSGFGRLNALGFGATRIIK